MTKFLTCIAFAAFLAGCNPKLPSGLRRNDLRKNIELITNHGKMIVHLYDSVPLHRDNFIRLVKNHYYDSVLFHRVIQHFMIQAGDPNSRRADSTARLGNGGPAYTIPAEIHKHYFHKKGVIAAARTGDDVNPLRASSGSQFYIVQGKKFTDAGLDSVETFRLKGVKIPLSHREVYKTLGGTPHLDQTYTIFGEVIDGYTTIDKIAALPTGGNESGNRPLKDVRILKARLISRRH